VIARTIREDSRVYVAFTSPGKRRFAFQVDRANAGVRPPELRHDRYELRAHRTFLTTVLRGIPWCDASLVRNQVLGLK